jgi:plasmid stabilization system protein ParE
MVAVIWSPKSLSRINEIAAYLEDVSGSSDVANQFVQSTFNSIRKPETFPNIGRMVPDYEDLFMGDTSLYQEIKMGKIVILDWDF